MKPSRTYLQLTQICMASLVLAGCGGGGSPGSTTSNGTNSTEQNLTGISANNVVSNGSAQADLQAQADALAKAQAEALAKAQADALAKAQADAAAKAQAQAQADALAKALTLEEADQAVAKAGLDITQPVVRSALKTQQRIGVNLAGVSDYSATHEFVDLVMQSRGFGLPGAPWSTTPIQLDPNDGWPLVDFGIVVMTGQETTVGLGGTYTIKYKGPSGAKVEAIAGTLGTLSNHTYDTVTQQHTWLFAFPEGAKQMFLSFTGTQGKLKDLKIIRPGYDADLPPTYTREYMAQLARFSTLRFMDWEHTNSADDVSKRWDDPAPLTWANRPTIHGKRCAGQIGMATSMPWERAIQLANLTGSDMWINVPMNASNDYVSNLARLIKKTLAVNLKVYVEYSNEVWNSGFVALNYNKDAALAALAASTKTTKVDYDGKTAPTYQWVLAYRYYAERSMQISELFRAEFPDQMMSRVRPVLAWRAAGGAGDVDDMFTFLSEAYGKLPSNYFYAYAGAPYYNLGDKQAVDGLSTDAVLTAMEARMPNVPTSYQYERNAATAKKYGMDFISYEGGPDTMGNGSLESKAAANRSPRMLDLCKTYLDDWAKLGGGLFMWFHSGAGTWNSSAGSWALAESMTTPEGPKLQCMNWAATTAAPLLAMRHMKGVAFDTAEVIDGDSTTSRLWWTPKLPEKPLERVYAIGDRTGGCYPLTLGTRFGGSTSPTFQVFVNGVKALDVQSLPRNDTNTPVTSNVGQVCLKQGANALVIKAITTATGGYIDTIQIGTTP
jgi:hypothetical protein